MPDKCKFIDEIGQYDAFGKEPELYFKGKPKRASGFGFTLTILYVSMFIGIFLYKLIRMINRTDVKFYDSCTFLGVIPSLKLNNEDFYGGLALGIPDTLEPFVDETIYYPKAYFKVGHRVKNTWNWEIKPIDLEVCKIEKFGSKYREIFKEKPLNNLYCLKNVDGTLEGHLHYERYSFIYIQIFPCINSTKNNNHCKPLEVIDSYLNDTFISFYMQDVELTPTIYKEPVHVRDKEVNIKLSRHLFKDIRAFFQIINVETDQDLIGFDIFENNKKETFVRFESTTVFNYLHEKSIYESGDAICDITLQLADQVLTHKRTYNKLIQIIGDIGGLMEFIYSFFNVITSFISEALYEKILVNNLFEFDLDKKIVLINLNYNKNKSLKTNGTINEDVKIVSRFSSNDHLPSISSPRNEENTIHSKREIAEDVFNKKNLSIEENLTKKSFKKEKKKSKSKTKVKPSFYSKLGKNDNTEVKNISLVSKNYKKSKNSNNQPNNIKIFDLDNNNKFKEKEIKFLEERKKIVSKIKINKFCLYSCFCLVRKTKNMQNILINEGMKIISEKLDIINIFKKVYRVEKSDIKKITKDEIFDMSKECKNLLKDIAL